MKAEYRIRKDGDYFVLEKFLKGERVKKWSLNPKKLALIYDLPEKKADTLPEIMQETNQKEPQKFAQHLLYEPLNEPLKKDFNQALNDLMNEVLPPVPKDLPVE